MGIVAIEGYLSDRADKTRGHSNSLDARTSWGWSILSRFSQKLAAQGDLY
ncbi:MAG: hypothetical protein AB4038_20150 [Prochloraceae cyanobacterium]